MKKKYCCPSCDSPVKEGDCDDCLVVLPTEIVLRWEDGRWNVSDKASSKDPIKALKKYFGLLGRENE